MRRFPFALCALAIAILVGCRPGERPPDAYGRGSDPLPPGAVLLTEAEYRELRAAGGLALTSDSAAEETAREAAQFEEDLEVISAFVRDHPEVGELGDLLPQEPVPDGRIVLPSGDGNYLYNLSSRGGGTVQVVTHDRRWFARTIASGIREFPTRGNQLGIYRLLYDAAPDDLREELDLAPPEAIEPDAGIEAQEILERNRAFATDEIVAQIIAALGPPQNAIVPPDVGFLTDCSQELGAGTGSDLSGSRYDGCCDLSPLGIVANYSWSQRPHLTCVKSQGNRGTCTAFANTSAIETLVSQTHGVRTNLSEQAYYNRARLAWAPGHYGDGLMSETGFQKMREESFLLYFENQWSYNPSYNRIDIPKLGLYLDSCVGYTETCSETTHQSALGCYDFGLWRFCIYYVPEKNPKLLGFRIGTSLQFWDPTQPETSLKWLKIVLRAGRPAVLGHPITSAWDSATTCCADRGFVVYKAHDTNRGGHGSHAVGFIDNDILNQILPTAPPGAGGGYIIVKNSWGNCVGDGGFFYLPYQSVLDYAADVTVLLWVL